MGHTNYWSNSNTKGMSRKCLTAVKKVVNHAYKAGIIQFESDLPGKPVCTSAVVRFNGVGDYGHETFCIDMGERWDFCKTNHKPYDVVVVAVLMVMAKYHEGFTWSSDGSAEHDESAKNLLKMLDIE